MTLVTCGNCGSMVAVTALDNHADECLRRTRAAVATALAKDKIAEARMKDTPNANR